MYNYFVLL